MNRARWLRWIVPGALAAVGCASAARDRAGVIADVQARAAGPPGVIGTEAAASPGAARAPNLPPGVSLERGISRDDAIAIALWSNAAFQETLADLDVARADLAQAGLLTNPVFSILFPLGPKQLEFTARLPLEVLWLRPRRVALATLDVERVGASLVQNGLDLVRDVDLAWTDAGATTERVRLAHDAIALNDEILRISEARYRAGDVAGSDVAVTRADATLARDDAARAERDAALAAARLRMLLGLPYDTPIVLSAAEPPYAEETTRSAASETRAAPNAPPDAAAPDEKLLVDAAFAARPDVRAAEIAIERARARQSLSKVEFLTLSGVADANGKGARGFEIGPGADFAIPIFNWNQGGVARAEAELGRAERHRDSVRDQVVRGVVEARARLISAQMQLTAIGSALPDLETYLRSTRRAYRGGEVSLLPVLQASRQLLATRTRALDARTELARARAELDHSVGQRVANTAAPAGLRS